MKRLLTLPKNLSTWGRPQADRASLVECDPAEKLLYGLRFFLGCEPPRSRTGLLICVGALHEKQEGVGDSVVITTRPPDRDLAFQTVRGAQHGWIPS